MAIMRSGIPLVTNAFRRSMPSPPGGVYERPMFVDNLLVYCYPEVIYRVVRFN